MKIALIEDNPGDVALVKTILNESDLDYTLLVYTNLSDSLHAKKEDVDVFLLDLNLPDSMGVDTFKTLFKSYPDKTIIVLSGIEDRLISVECVRLGATDFICKSDITTKSLSRCILYSIERSNRLVVERKLLTGVRANLEAILMRIDGMGLPSVVRDN